MTVHQLSKTDARRIAVRAQLLDKRRPTKLTDVVRRCRRDILDRLGSSGPLPSRELPETCKVRRRSSGWTNNQNVTKLLDLMVQRGEVAIAGRKGRERLWDLASRVYPEDPIVEAGEAGEALRRRDELRLRALGIARSKGPFCGVDSADVGDAGEPAVVDREIKDLARWLELELVRV